MGKRSTSRTPSRARRIGPANAAHAFRIRAVLALLLFGFGAIVFRLAQLQAAPDVRLTQEDHNHKGWRDIPVPRGNILDRNGRVLALDRDAPSLWADPRYVDDPRKLAAQLRAVLDIDPDTVAARLAKTDSQQAGRRFAWVKRWLTQDELERLEEGGLLDNRRLGIEQEPLRYYPEGSLAAHALGFVNRDRAGGGGIEFAFDKYLRSVAGKQVARRSGGETRRLLASLTLEYEPPTGGDHLYLTLDRNIQRYLEEELDAALVRTQAPRAMGVVMDPNTGAILALACRPTFNPNRFWEFAPNERKNRALVDVFEPGSAFKIVIAAAALEQKVVTPDMPIDCEQKGRWYMGLRRWIRDDHILEGEQPFSVCFAQSSNIAMNKVALRLGPDQIEAWIRRFGFGETTGSDFPGESRGIFLPQSQWSGYSVSSLAMGYEINVTMLQLVRAFAAVANGGMLVTPYIVERAVSREGTVTYQHPHQEPKRIVAVETANTVKELCHRVVTEGTGSRASIREYRVGGKTGTAQIPPYRDKNKRYNAVFAGFAPVGKPMICAVIVVQEPGAKKYYGGYCAAPVFKEVVRKALTDMNCPLDPVARPVKTDNGKDGIMADEAARIAAALELLAPLDDMDLLEDPRLAAYERASAYAGPRLPDFRGMTKREAKAETVSLGIVWDPHGSGRVVSQTPSPGTPLADVSLCRLVFSHGSKREGGHETKRTADISRL
ncbi:MAG TPA: transpeptidase family protein [Candidatus Hydrogenedentes bacterium]|nr:transpeptidase family protein [Candidatus Hydrogenedentota bacterium]